MSEITTILSDIEVSSKSLSAFNGAEIYWNEFDETLNIEGWVNDGSYDSSYAMSLNKEQWSKLRRFFFNRWPTSRMFPIEEKP